VYDNDKNQYFSVYFCFRATCMMVKKFHASAVNVVIELQVTCRVT
jgi:hypothetical protein